ncbi:MAG: hypothetical protein AAB725_00880 [Patescibacteria group bacterium]
MKKNRFRKKTAQDIQDEIFRRMTADKKVKLASALAMFCLSLNRLNDRRNKSGKIAG